MNLILKNYTEQLREFEMQPRRPGEKRRRGKQKDRAIHDKRFFVAREKANTFLFLERTSIKLIHPVQNCYLITDGRIKLIEVIEYFLKGKTGSDLYIGTLSYGAKEVDQILHWYDSGIIKKIRIIRSKFYVGERQGLYEQVQYELEKRGQKTIGIDTHCKIFLVKSGNKCVTITGSMNLTSNSMMENMIITRDLGTFKFFKKWFDVTFGE
jgi:hypothetical protein